MRGWERGWEEGWEKVWKDLSMGGIWGGIIRGVRFDGEALKGLLKGLEIWEDLDEEGWADLVEVLNGMPEKVKNSKESIEQYLKKDWRMVRIRDRFGI